MKKLAVLCCVAVILFSCTKGKNNSPVVNDLPTTSDSSYLASIKNYAPGYKLVDSFGYDTGKRVTSFVQYVFDSTQGSPHAGHTTMMFSYANSNSVVPASYTATYLGGATNEVHQLYYDNQNRIIKDTASAAGSGFKVTYYAYSNNSIISTVLFDGTYDDTQVDTMFLNNGNIAQTNIYYHQSPDSAYTILSFSSYNNPGYHSAIASTIGPLLNIFSIDNFAGIDFVSKKLAIGASVTDDGSTPASITYTVTPDSKGRVGELTNPGLSGESIYSYY
jgi:hypothetical protein